MKKLLLLIIAIGFLFGCAGQRIRTVEDDNIFYSNSTPKIRIKINPYFKFNKETGDYQSSFNLDYGEKSSNRKVAKFLFIDQISGKSRVIEIMIVELVAPNWQFKPNIFPIKDPFSKGTVKMQGQDYQYCIFADRTPDDILLIKGVGKLVGGRGNAIIVIYYIEQVTGDWSNFNRLTSKQKKQLEEFIEDSENGYKILEYKAPTSTPSKGKWGALSFTSHRG